MSGYYIESKYIENTNSSNDIFSYIREYFNVDNPHTENILHISASSTSDGNDYNKSDISTLIRKPDGLNPLNLLKKKNFLYKLCSFFMIVFLPQYIL